MNREAWEAWKDRNADWYLPCVAVPLVIAICSGLVIFWLPLAIGGSVWHWLHAETK